MSMQNVLFGGAALNSAIADFGRAVLRFGVGLALALGHGIGKIPPSDGLIDRAGSMGFPAPTLFAWLSGLAEFGGALLLAIGLATRPAALFVAFNMTVVVSMAHAGDPFGDRERGFLFLAVAVFFVLAGGGRFSADHLLYGRRTMTTRI